MVHGLWKAYAFVGAGECAPQQSETPRHAPPSLLPLQAVLFEGDM